MDKYRNKVGGEVYMGLEYRDNHIHGVVLFQVMRNPLEGFANVRVSGIGIGTRATRMRSDTR